MKEYYHTAIVLSAGKGSRMKSQIKKQYMLLKDRPVIVHCLQTFQSCPQIQEIILVCGEGEEEWCRKEIAQAYGLSKLIRIVAGGKERYDSVYEGLKQVSPQCTHVLIHDGARPLIDQEMLYRLLEEVHESGACIAAVPVKDTIKRGDQENFVAETLPRSELWTIQTPQVFSYPEIFSAYQKILTHPHENLAITDDAMILEQANGQKIRLIEGSYRNLKITTPEDLKIAEALLS